MIVDSHQHFWLAGRLSMPPIASGTMEPWRGLIARIADHRNVSGKISGMIAEANHGAWTPAHLRPYVDHVFSSYGVDGMMFGSDWPVCLLAGSYSEVINAVRPILGWRLDSGATAKIFGENAPRFYGLGGPS